MSRRFLLSSRLLSQLDTLSPPCPTQPTYGIRAMGNYLFESVDATLFLFFCFHCSFEVNLALFLALVCNTHITPTCGSLENNRKKKKKPHRSQPRRRYRRLENKERRHLEYKHECIRAMQTQTQTHRGLPMFLFWPFVHPHPQAFAIGMLTQATVIANQRKQSFSL